MSKWFNDIENLVPEAVLVKETPPQISEIDRALIIIHATWSGPSHAIVKKILSEIQNVSKVLDYEVYILDIDNLEIKYIESILNGKKAHGYAESVWVENGNIQKLHLKQKELEPFIEYVKSRI